MTPWDKRLTACAALCDYARLARRQPFALLALEAAPRADAHVRLATLHERLRLDLGVPIPVRGQQGGFTVAASSRIIAEISPAEACPDM